MDRSDFLSMGDIEQARAALLSTRRRVLGAVIFTTVIGGSLMWLLVYYLKFHDAALSTLVAFLFSVLAGVPVFVRWWRHYDLKLMDLDLVAKRVANGEREWRAHCFIHPKRRRDAAPLN